MNPMITRRSPEKQEHALRLLCQNLPLNTAVPTSTREMADKTGLKETVIQDMKIVLEFVGGMRSHDGPSPRKVGKACYWTRLYDLTDLKKLLADHDLDISEPSRKKILSIKRAKIAAGTAEDGTQITVAGPDAPSPMADLAQARVVAAQPEALIEALRRYCERDSFIEEQRRKFAELGIDLRPDAIRVKRDPVFEAMKPILPYITRLENQVSTLQDRLQRQANAASDSGHTSSRVKSQADQIAKLVSERAALAERLMNEQQEAREKMQAKDREIARLRLDLGALTKKNTD